jgi:hypothetical protein
MNPYIYTEDRFNNYLKNCIQNISKVSETHFSQEDYQDSQKEYLQTVHMEVKTLLNSLESLFSHHKYELINNTKFDLFNTCDASSISSVEEKVVNKGRNIMDFMNSIISSGANTDECSDSEPPHYVEANSDDNNDLVESSLSGRVNNFNSFKPSRFVVAAESDNEEDTDIEDHQCNNIFTEEYHSDSNNEDEEDEEEEHEEEEHEEEEHEEEEHEDNNKSINTDNEDKDIEEDTSNQVLYNGLCVARVKRKKELPDEDTPSYIYRDEEGFIYGRQCNSDRKQGELLCLKHKEKCNSEKFSYIFNPPPSKLTVKNPSNDDKECTISLKTMFYGTEKFYLNPINGDVYDYNEKVIIGKKINDEEIIFDDGEDH